MTRYKRTKREELDSLRLTALDQNIGQSRALNVLQRTQLAERQRLMRQFL